MLGRNLSIFSWSSYVQFANVWKTDDTHDDEWRRPWRPSISCDNCIKVTHCTRIMWDYLISNLFCNIFGHVSLPTYSARRSLTSRLSLIPPLLLDRSSQLLTITCLLLNSYRLKFIINPNQTSYETVAGRFANVPRSAYRPDRQRVKSARQRQFANAYMSVHHETINH